MMKENQWLTEIEKDTQIAESDPKCWMLSQPLLLWREHRQYNRKSHFSRHFSSSSSASLYFHEECEENEKIVDDGLYTVSRVAKRINNVRLKAAYDIYMNPLIYAEIMSWEKEWQRRAEFTCWTNMYWTDFLRHFSQEAWFQVDVSQIYYLYFWKDNWFYQ